MAIYNRTAINNTLQTIEGNSKIPNGISKKIITMALENLYLKGKLDEARNRINLIRQRG